MIYLLSRFVFIKSIKSIAPDSSKVSLFCVDDQAKALENHALLINYVAPHDVDTFFNT